MILKSDLFALLLVSVACLFLLWDSRRLKSPVYLVAKIIAVVIIILWLMAAFFYSQQ